MRSRFLALAAVAGGFLPGLVPSAHAALIAIAPSSFVQTTQTVTFGGPSDDGTVNPSYTVLPGVTVSFGSYFTGQALTSSPDDGGLYYLTGTTPSAPLSLASDSDNYAVVTTDASTADPDNERLAGAAPGQFLGPVAVLFSTAVQQVAFTAGVFSEAGNLSIQAFAADGTSLGVLANTGTGDQRFFLADSNGASIAGLSFYIPDQSLNGFSIDDVAASVLPPSPPTAVPEPGSLPILAAGALAGLAVVRRRRTRYA